MNVSRLALPALSLLLAATGLGCITINLPSGELEPLVETVVAGQGESKVLLVEIDGVISETSEVADFFGTVSEGTVSRLREELDRARQDAQVKAVVLRINSPGGTVTGSDLLYQEVMRFKRERNVPVVAHLMGVAASGGYYVAVAADTIHAQRTSVTGSIGVIFSGINVSGLMEKIGVADQTMTSGRFKDAGSMLRPMRPEERAQLQSVIDDLYFQFVEVVQSGRSNLTPEQVQTLADGRIYSATQALENGLVDQIGTLEDSVNEARRRAGLQSAQVVTYHRPREYADNYYTQPPEQTGSALIDLWPDALPLRGPAFLYLWAPGLGIE